MKKLWKLHPKMCGVLLLSAICFPSETFAENEQQYLNLFSISSVQSYLLDDVDKITFSDDVINVSMADQSTISVLYDNLDKLTFGENASLAIKTVKRELDSSLSVYYQPSNQYVCIESSALIKSIGVYNTQGRIVLYTSPRAEITTISIEDLPSGLYIVRVDNGKAIKSQKIIKQ